jgi:outer membrane protein assembly factor BamB
MLPVAGALAAVDFPQWRGPNRDGVVGSVKLPAAWPDKLTRKWRMAVGEGHASPVLSAGRLYVFARQGENEILRAVDPAAGKVVWTSSNAAPYTVNPAATKHRKGPKSTPVVTGGRVVTLGISGILSVHDAATGKVLWRKEFGKEFRETSPLYGAAMSPIVVDGLVIAHVGGDGGGALTAFDLAAGAVRWRWAEDGPGYSSPVVVTVAGKRQVVTQSEKNIVSVDPKDGKAAWKIPFTTPYAQNSVTPLVHGDKLILSGLSNGTMCLRWRGQGRLAQQGNWNVYELARHAGRDDLRVHQSQPGPIFRHEHAGRQAAVVERTAQGRQCRDSAGRRSPVSLEYGR